MKRFFAMFLFLLCACAPAPALPAPPPDVTLPTPPRYRVVLDYGHGGQDSGAVGVETRVHESGLNLAVGELVAGMLTESGVDVIRTRTDGDALADTKRADMRLRGQILNTPGTDLAVSVHMNKFPDRSVSGPMAYYQTGSSAGEALATCCINALTAALALPARMPNPGDNFVTRVPAAPAVLIECGFLSNAADENNLQDPAYQHTLARAIADGVLRYLEEQPPPDDTYSDPPLSVPQVTASP